MTNTDSQEIGPEWQPCVKLPITVHVREQRPGETHSSTREGITPLRHDDLIMRGVQGEEYPIGRELFNKTYRLGSAPDPVDASSLADLLEKMAYGIERTESIMDSANMAGPVGFDLMETADRARKAAQLLRGKDD